MRNETAINLEDYENDSRENIEEEETTSLLSDNHKSKKDKKHMKLIEEKKPLVENISFYAWHNKLFETFDSTYMSVMTVSYFI